MCVDRLYFWLNFLFFLGDSILCSENRDECMRKLGIAILLAGFLPEAWDKLFAKYLYPSFTPTVFLFVAGTTAYGVLKYLQNEKSEGES